MSFLPRNSLLCLALGGLVACGGDPAPTVTVVTGNVKDAATDEPLADAKVEVRLGEQARASGRSDASGNFLLQFEVPPRAVLQTFVLSASLDGYGDAPRALAIDKGKPSEGSYSLRLVPEGVASCMQRARPAVVVGHFRPAPGRPDPNLSERIADTLRFDLLEQIQKAKFNVEPGIFPCDAAAPKVPGNYGGYARLLGADAYIGGFVTSPDPVKVKVHMLVADGHSVFTIPLSATSSDVDLDNPQLARLAPEANAAILTALVIGYKLSNKPQECVDLIAASERLLGSLPPALVRLREDCQSALPNRGLL